MDFVETRFLCSGTLRSKEGTFSSKLTLDPGTPPGEDQDGDDTTDVEE